MTRYPEPLRRLMDAFLILPGIGRRTAERFAFSLLEGIPERTQQLSDALLGLHQQLILCGRCGQYSEKNPCLMCADTARNHQELYVVAASRDIFPLEQTGLCRGYYYVLGRLLNPLEGLHPEHLRTASLLARLKEGQVHEVILALNPNVEGDATALYLAHLLNPLNLKITRLARGLPTGARLEYADEATLKSAFLNRDAVPGQKNAGKN